VIVTDPAATPVVLPLESTLAIEAAEDDQVTPDVSFTTVPSLYFAEAAN